MNHRAIQPKVLKYFSYLVYRSAILDSLDWMANILER